MALYKNKASQKVACFAYDPTDGSAVTGDAANITAQISKDGAATAATNDTNPTELDAGDAPGIYLFDLTQTESNADLIVIAPVSGTADVLIEPLIIYTEPEIRSADVTAVSGDSTAADTLELFAEALDQSTGQVDAGTFAAGAIDAAAVANGAIDAATFAADVDAEIRSYVGLAAANLDTQLDAIPTAAEIVNEWESQSQDDPTGFHVNVLEIGGTAQTANDNGADINAILEDTDLIDDGTSGLAKIATDVAAILVDTAVIGAAGAGLTEAGGTGDHLTAIPWNADWDTQVESEVTDSLVAHNLDHLCLTATAAADMTAEVADNTILSRILSNGDTSVFDPSTDGLQPIRDRGDAAWATATGFSTHSAADVWAVATRVLTAGTNIQLPANGLANVTTWTVNITGSVSGAVGSVTGAVGSVMGNVGGNVTGTVGGFTTAAKAEIEAEATDALNAYDPPTNAEMAARTLAAASYATAAGVSAVETDTQDIQSRLPATLTAASMMKCEVLYVNAVQVGGTGAEGDEWGPA